MITILAMYKFISTHIYALNIYTYIDVYIYTHTQRSRLRSPASSMNSRHKRYHLASLSASCIHMASFGFVSRLTLSSWLYLWPLVIVKEVEIGQRQNVIIGNAMKNKQNYQNDLLSLSTHLHVAIDITWKECK